jgi:hypothetical protein
LSKSEFCRKYSLTPSTLERNLKKNRLAKAGQGPRLVAVELNGAGFESKTPACSGLEVILSSGRRIEVRRDFDCDTLRRVVQILEES